MHSRGRKKSLRKALEPKETVLAQKAMLVHSIAIHKAQQDIWHSNAYGVSMHMA
jgi:hypothetical protein